jgi:two-component sensor histidine kinase/PAS domain-containing protein
MATFAELISKNSQLRPQEIEHLSELVAEWRLLADLSFADLLLWLPIRKDDKSWPTGYVAIAQIRPTTTATVFNNDLIGSELVWGINDRIDQALSSGEILRDSKPEKVGELMIKEEMIPVHFEGKTIAVIARHRNSELMRSPSKLELNYREIAHKIFQMVAEGNFPIRNSIYNSESAPRVGDGLLRLDINGVITYASPNARSAFGRLSWNSALEGLLLTEVAEQIATPQNQAHEEALRVQLSGRAIRRVEMENSGGTIELLVLPLIQGSDRIGALVLLQNVTELRRRERELVTKDATIREIHHRVKNNLQTVSALLRLQSRRIDDPAASAALNEAVRRIASIALVHETLSSGADASVAFDDVLDRLVSHSLDLSSRMNELVITRSGQLGSLDPAIATPLSLVVTELIHNALEHGLENGGSSLEILLERSAGTAQISIIDNGVGLPEGFDLATSSNLGLQIVRTLTENELKGELVLESTERGTTARLTFPI